MAMAKKMKRMPRQIEPKPILISSPQQQQMQKMLVNCKETGLTSNRQSFVWKQRLAMQLVIAEKEMQQELMTKIGSTLLVAMVEDW